MPKAQEARGANGRKEITVALHVTAQEYAALRLVEYVKNLKGVGLVLRTMSLRSAVNYARKHRGREVRS